MQNRFNEFHAKKKDAKIKLTLRILVALYILYLTKGIVGAAVQHTSSLPLWVTIAVSSVFLLASAVFIIYAWRQYKNSPAESAGECEQVLSEKDDENSAGHSGQQ